jgi:TP901 family phage tail tape measure protein
MAQGISYIIKAIDKISAPARKIAASAKKMGNSFSKAAFQIDFLSKKTKKGAKEISAAQAMMNRAGAGLGRTFVGLTSAYLGFNAAQKALKVGMDFEDRIAEVSAITGATGKNLKFISDESLRLAKVSYTSAEEVAEGFKLIASSQAHLLESPEKLSQITEQAILLKNAAGIDLATSARTLGISLNQFGVGADQAARFVDVLAAGAKHGASEIDETSQALIKVGQAAKISGLTFEETNAAIQALAKGGQIGSIAGRGFSAVLLKAQKAGLDFKKVGLAKGFGLIRDKVNSIKDPAERANAIMKTFGLENVKTIETLMAQAHTLDDLTEKMHERGIAQEQADVQNRTLSKSYKLLGITLSEKVIKVYERMKPALNKLTNSSIKFLESLDQESLNAIADGFMAIGSVLGFVWKIAVGLFAMLKGIITVLTNVGAAAWTIGTGGLFGDTELIDVLKSAGRGMEGAFDIGGKTLGFMPELDKGLNTSGATKAGNQTIATIELLGATNQVGAVKEKQTGGRSGRVRFKKNSPTPENVAGGVRA